MKPKNSRYFYDNNSAFIPSLSGNKKPWNGKDVTFFDKKIGQVNSKNALEKIKECLG